MGIHHIGSCFLETRVKCLKGTAALNSSYWGSGDVELMCEIRQS